MDEHRDQRDPETHAIIGAAMTVHRELGHGFLDAVYQEALAIEFDHCEIPYEKEKSIEVWYRGNRLNCGYRADFVCYDSIVVELKAMRQLSDPHYGIVINYVKATKLKRGLLLNFGAPSLQFKGVARNYD